MQFLPRSINGSRELSGFKRFEVCLVQLDLPLVPALPAERSSAEDAPPNPRAQSRAEVLLDLLELCAERQGRSVSSVPLGFRRE